MSWGKCFKIGFVAPMSWEPLREFVPEVDKLPRPLEFFFGAQLVANLRRRGHEIHVFTLCRDAPEDIHMRGDGVWIHVGGYRHGVVRRMLTGFVAERNVLRRMMAAYPCDIYHAHWSYEFARPVVESGLPHLVTMHDNPWRVLMLFRPKSYRFCRLLLSYYVLCRTRHLSAVSPYMAKYCERVHGMRDVRIIPNALALPPGVSIGGVFARQKKGVRCDKVAFVEVANGVSGCKNIPLLLKAFQLLRGMTSVQCELHVFGNGNEPDGEASRWAARHKVALDDVVLHGPVPHDDMLRQIADVADVFVHASLEESFGIAIIEAMALGLPTIVGAKSGAAAWVAGDGETGMLVDMEKISDLAVAMKRLAEDKKLRSKFGHASAERFRRMFTLDTVTDQYERLYREILSKC